MASFTLPAGQYEFPFDLSLDPNMHDTITGPNHSYLSYQVYAIVERKLYRNHVVSQPLRIYKPAVRDRCDVLLSDPIITEELADTTIPYSVSIPHKKIPFGSTFPVNFWMAPLEKGLRMKAINIAVVEKHSIKIDAPAAYATRYGVRYLTSAKDHIVLSERHEGQEEDYLAAASEMFDIEWSTTKAVALPKSLEECTQRVKSNHIQVHHELIFSVELVSAKGNLSTISGALPFNIVILPRSVTSDGLAHGFEIEEFSYDHDSPPLYGAHMTDTLLCGDLADLELRAGGPYSLATSDLTCAPCYEREFGPLLGHGIAERPQRMISG
ncbi:arrestin C-terminal domain-containing protein [Aspergillus affinis]|uniref:arrestin C-terminal domain-containing protein n=1 Tax=Aspergillus affinis TaxID=1070780 RepID=UPI0022FED6F1|nr:uncharacterized protein KD926_006826 [Aspergillus affinis]KAI9041430.1 hypothetical protein KD926_006826 [Aspergillus affinis]